MTGDGQHEIRHSHTICRYIQIHTHMHAAGVRKKGDKVLEGRAWRLLRTPARFKLSCQKAKTNFRNFEADALGSCVPSREVGLQLSLMRHPR